MITPLHDRIIVKRLESESTSRGGIIFPENKDNKPDRGVVLAVGPGYVNKDKEIVPLSIKVGHIVIFGKNVGQTIKTDEGVVLAMREQDVLAYSEE